jgi:hypothetical protein
MTGVMDGRADAAGPGPSQVKEVAGWSEAYDGSPCTSPDDAAKFIKEKKTGSRIVHIKAGQDPDVKNDAWVVGIVIYLATNKNFSDEAVYEVAKAAWQNQKELEAIHPIFKEWTPSNIVSPDVVIPYHPGAIRFTKRRSDAMDKLQTQLLAR